MAPPISKTWGSDSSRCCFLRLLQQKNTATPMMKATAMPDATDIPITAAALIP
jgi:hypothetical protein